MRGPADYYTLTVYVADRAECERRHVQHAQEACCCANTRSVTANPFPVLAELTELSSASIGQPKKLELLALKPGGLNRKFPSKIFSFRNLNGPNVAELLGPPGG